LRPKELLKMSIIDIEVGTGAPAAAGSGSRSITRVLKDGTKSISSRDRPEAVAILQGRRQVIRGWEAGFDGERSVESGASSFLIRWRYGDKGSAR